MADRPFRFLADAREIATLAELRETVRHAESVGIDTLVIPDHLIPQLAPLPAMAAIAALSDRLRISAFVLNSDLRHPAVLARAEELLDSPHIYIGTAGDFVTKFQRLRSELGVTSIMVGAVGAMDEVVERLAGT